MTLFEEKAETIARLKRDYGVDEVMPMVKAEKILHMDRRLIIEKKVVPVHRVSSKYLAVKLVDIVDYILGINQNPYKKARRLG